jgi:NADH-quinone oxidoreductase subunit E
MLSKAIRQRLETRIAASSHPRELVVDIMYALQSHYGFLNDVALREVAELLSMSPVEVEELATFYDFIYRRPVGRFVLHVCDGVVCWMFEEQSALDYICKSLGVEPGETTADGQFTVLPTVCIGYCDHAPAMLINGKLYGPLTPELIDRTLEELRSISCDMVICR